MSPLQAQLDRIRRRQGLVLAITLLAMAGSFAFAYLGGTTYTGRAALTVSSSDRSPEQDAPLAQGYVEYFNQDFAQDSLRERAGIPSTTTFAAVNSAASPIIYIEATAPTTEAAVDGARALAVAFRDDINGSIQQQSEAPIAALRSQIDEITAQLPGASAEEAALLSGQVNGLQERILTIQGETANNQLKDLSLNAGVTSTPPNVVQNTVLGLVGGLILGVVVALGLALAEDRLVTPQEVRDRLGLDTLAVVKQGDDELREQQLKSLANVVSLSDMSRPAVLAITAVRATPLSSEVVVGLALYRAQQGERVLLIRADLDASRQPSSARGPQGLGDFLAARPGTRLEPMVVPNVLGSMLVLPAGRSQDDPYALFGPERFVDAIEQASRMADLIVIDAPPIVEAAEAQVICSSADRTILVVEEGVTRASDAVEAKERLDRVHADVLGVVIGQAGRSKTGTVAAEAEPGESTTMMRNLPSTGSSAATGARRGRGDNATGKPRPTPRVDARG